MQTAAPSIPQTGATIVIKPSHGQVQPSGKLDLRLIISPGLKSLSNVHIEIHVFDVGNRSEGAADDGSVVETVEPMKAVKIIPLHILMESAPIKFHLESKEAEEKTAKSSQVHRVLSDARNTEILTNHQPQRKKAELDATTSTSVFHSFGVLPQCSTDFASKFDKLVPRSRLYPFKLLKLKNLSAQGTWFYVHGREQSALHVQPGHGWFPGDGGVVELKIWLTPDAATLGIREETLFVEVLCSNRLIKCHVAYEVVPAKLQLVKDNCNFAHQTVVGGSASEFFMLKNAGGTVLRALVDLNGFEEFEVSPSPQSDELAGGGVVWSNDLRHVVEEQGTDDEKPTPSTSFSRSISKSSAHDFNQAVVKFSPVCKQSQPTFGSRSTSLGRSNSNAVGEIVDEGVNVDEAVVDEKKRSVVWQRVDGVHEDDVAVLLESLPAAAAASSHSSDHSRIFMVELQPFQSVKYTLTFCPVRECNHEFQFPIFLTGHQSLEATLSQRDANVFFIPVQAAAIPSPLTLSRQKIQFSTSIIRPHNSAILSNHLLLSHEQFEVTNLGADVLSWRLETMSHTKSFRGSRSSVVGGSNYSFISSSHFSANASPVAASNNSTGNPFKFDAYGGLLDPGESAVITARFTPSESGIYSKLVHLVSDRPDNERVSMALQLDGVAVESSIVFYPPEIFIPVVPPGLPMVIPFQLVNYGCERTEVQYEFTSDFHNFLPSPVSMTSIAGKTTSPLRDTPRVSPNTLRSTNSKRMSVLNSSMESKSKMVPSPAARLPTADSVHRTGELLSVFFPEGLHCRFCGGENLYLTRC